jgi:hypothetical protein
LAALTGQLALLEDVVSRSWDIFAYWLIKNRKVALLPPICHLLDCPTRQLHRMMKTMLGMKRTEPWLRKKQMEHLEARAMHFRVFPVHPMNCLNDHPWMNNYNS